MRLRTREALALASWALACSRETSLVTGRLFRADGEPARGEQVGLRRVATADAPLVEEQLLDLGRVDSSGRYGLLGRVDEPGIYWIGGDDHEAGSETWTYFAANFTPAHEVELPDVTLWAPSVTYETNGADLLIGLTEVPASDDVRVNVYSDVAHGAVLWRQPIVGTQSITLPGEILADAPASIVLCRGPDRFQFQVEPMTPTVGYGQAVRTTLFGPGTLVPRSRGAACGPMAAPLAPCFATDGQHWSQDTALTDLYVENVSGTLRAVAVYNLTIEGAEPATVTVDGSSTGGTFTTLASITVPPGTQHYEFLEFPEVEATDVRLRCQGCRFQVAEVGLF